MTNRRRTELSNPKAHPKSIFLIIKPIFRILIPALTSVRRSRITILVKISLAFLVFAFLSCAQTNPVELDRIVSSNVEVFERLASRLGHTIVGKIALRQGDVLAFFSMQSSDLEFLSHGVVRGMQAAGCSVLVGPQATSAVPKIKMQFLEGRVEYGKAFRDGMFGTKLTERSVTLQASVEAHSGEPNQVVFSDMLNEAWTDTVSVSIIGDLESAQLGVTQARPPAEPLLDRLFAPVVIIGATAVVIYLFFTVRS